MRRARVRTLPPVVIDPKTERKFHVYAHQRAKPNMEKLDRLPPFERALVHFYGVDRAWSHLSSDGSQHVPEILGRADEFWAYWSEEKMISEAKSRAKEAETALAWGKILGR